ncbi:MAG: Ppx/GppA phosphatase family protein [Hyphomicrobiales bacterium]
MGEEKNRSRLEKPRYEPVSIIDIGSNSVRLVVYDGPGRAPMPIFNEKILCGLGKSVASTGGLTDESVERAFGALRRFKRLSKQIGAASLHAVATAAARQAENGEDFIDRAREILGGRIMLLSGEREAELAAQGVLYGIPGADGLVGDLGGGSLELVEVADGSARRPVTMPIGPLQLMDLSGGSIVKARAIVGDLFSDHAALEKMRGRAFYAVGGTWRNLARLHMTRNHYPLSVLHHYTIARDAARSLAGLIAELSPQTIKEIPAIKKSRAKTLPYGALVLDQLLKKTKSSNVVVSAFGVREGILFAKLDKNERRRDPLLVACIDFAHRHARCAGHEFELCDWTDGLFAHDGPKESLSGKRLRHAACFLADIGWRIHPSYRGEHVLSLVSQGSFAGVNHEERIFLAFTVFFRYVGPLIETIPSELTRLIDDNMIERARLIAAAQRLAYLLSGAMPGMLGRIDLSIAGKALTLSIPVALKALMGERVERRFRELALLASKIPQIRIVEQESEK